ncbi:MAG: diacylglycerol kinase family lipid kinase [bacterium]|nr:diacylglycerol kinase family lipid kinase [bacterium]
MKKKRVAFLINPCSGVGRGRKRYLQVLEWLNKNSLEKRIEPTFFFSEKSGEYDTSHLAGKISNEGYDVLAVIGGDGTLNEVANGLSGSQIPVLVIPSGSGNDFAKALRIPRKVEEILDLIENGQIHSVDLGRVNGRIFVNIFGVGVVAEVVRSAENLKNGLPFLPKVLLYLIALLRQLCSRINYPHVFLEKSRNATVCQETIGRVTLLMVSNGYSCGGIFKLAPDADLEDGLLDICFIKKTSRWRILRFLGKVIAGTHLSLHEVEKDADNKLPKASHFVICSMDGTNIPCQMDGDLLPARKRYEIFILPGYLRVFGPAVLATVQDPIKAKAEALEYQPA